MILETHILLETIINDKKNLHSEAKFDIPALVKTLVLPNSNTDSERAFSIVKNSHFFARNLIMKIKYPTVL